MSTAARPLNDDEVFSEMKKMVAFIKQEALEKAREIKVKADEEFALEKAKLVRQESVNIDAAAQRRLKQAEVERKIQQSTQVNKARLRVLQARDQMVEDLLEAARQRLSVIVKDKKKYKAFLRASLLQAFLQLMESEVMVQCCRRDIDVVKAAVADAVADYRTNVGRDIAAVIDTENFLDDECTGGVIVSALYGRIRCLNTLESRLDLIAEQVSFSSCANHSCSCRCYLKFV